MLYPFYQRIVPMNHLVHVGDFDVPDNMLEIPMPVYNSNFAWMEGPHLVAPQSTGQVVRYKRQHGEIFDCFVGVVRGPALAGI